MEKIPYYHPMKKLFKEFDLDVGEKLLEKLEQDLDKEYRNILNLFLSDLESYFKSKTLDELLQKESKLWKKVIRELSVPMPIARGLTKLYVYSTSLYYVKRLREDQELKAFILSKQIYLEYFLDALYIILGIARLLEQQKWGDFYLPKEEKDVIMARMLYFSPFFFFSNLFGKNKDQEFYVFFKLVKHYRFVVESYLDSKSRMLVTQSLEQLVPRNLD